jgi:phosphoglycolate phosphatase
MMQDVHPVDAVLFDFDGTLGDSYPAITASVNHVRSLHGLPPLTLEQVKPHVGRGPVHLVSVTVGGPDPEADARAYRAHHPSVMIEGTHLMPGARSALEALHRRRIKLAVCSNKPAAFTPRLLEHFGVGALFDLVLGAEH